MGRASGAGSTSVLPEGKRGSGLGSVRPEHLHAKSGERVSNYVMGDWDVLCIYGKIMFSGKGEEAAKEGHYVGAA